MAVYQRSYRGYTGELTPTWARLLVLPRYDLATIFSSRLFLGFFLLCFIWPLILIVMVYLRHNSEALAILASMASLESEQLAEQLAVGGYAARTLFQTPTGSMAFVIALIVGPALISPDLRNNAMPLYLSRPFTRGEYVLSKLITLLALMSAVTWIPGLLLFAFQAYLEPGWLVDHWQLGWAVLVGAWAWILPLALLALAFSAWVKWKPLARLLFLGGYFVLFGLANVVNALYKTDWGALLHLGALRDTVWDQLYGQPIATGLAPLAAWLALAAIAGFCLLALSRKIRAYEVVSS